MSGLQAKIAQRARVGPTPRLLTTSVPAPILGWNARDALSDMDPRYAVRMDNYVSDGSNVRLRSGTADHVTGFVGPVEFVHTLAIGDQRKLVAFANGSAYDATVAGTVGAALASGFASNRWFGANAGASGGETGIYTNGVDPAQQYDGITWAASGITGPAKPTGVTVSKKRVWVVDKGTGSAWYGPPEAVTGAFAEFNVGSVHPEGGDLVAIGNVTLDGGEGPDDLTVFVMKSGAIIVYAGTDPADAAAWAVRGVWKGGNPIGDRCLVPFDDDLIYISDAGFQSIRRFTAQGKLAGVPISDTITRAVSNASIQFENNYGWHGAYNPHLRQLIFNVPRVENSLSDQYVMNSIYGTWSKFSGWNAFTSAVRENALYMGTEGKIIKTEDGRLNDSDNAVPGYVQTAWNYFRARGQQKLFLSYRPNIFASTVVSLGLGIGVDFVDPTISFTSSTEKPPGARWNLGEWNVDAWAKSPVVTANWRGAGAIGFNASFAFQTSTRVSTVELLATDVLANIGGPL